LKAKELARTDNRSRVAKKDAYSGVGWVKTRGLKRCQEVPCNLTALFHLLLIKQSPLQPAQPLRNPKQAPNNKHSSSHKPKEEVVYEGLFTSTYRKKT
jgi:hypothetical protein